MFKELWLICLTLLIASCSSIQDTTSNKHKVSIDVMRNSTVALVDKLEDIGYLSYCSGVWIDQKTILTAYHCVSRDPQTVEELFKKITQNIDPEVVGAFVNFKTWNQIQTTNDNEQPYKTANTAMIVAVDTENDLAMLTSVEEDFQHDNAKVSKTTSVADGAKVHIIGHNRHLPYSYAPGVISNTRTLKNPDGHTTKLLQINSSAWRGYSGGGAFGSNGELVGITSFLWNPQAVGPLLTMFVHHDSIIAFLESEHWLK